MKCFALGFIVARTIFSNVEPEAFVWILGLSDLIECIDKVAVPGSAAGSSVSSPQQPTQVLLDFPERQDQRAGSAPRGGTFLVAETISSYER